MTEAPILVSACLAGYNCRYNGGNKLVIEIAKLVDAGRAIPVCPEIFGGLPTPRPPAERRGNKVITNDGHDITDSFKQGAKATLEIARRHKCAVAVFKTLSPSCGKGLIYDGTFSDKLIEGDGLTAQLLSESGIKVITENEINDLSMSS